VVRETQRRGHVRTFEQHFRLPGGKRRRCRDVHRHHFVSAAIEKFLAVVIPYRLGSAFSRDLPLSAWAPIWAHVDLVAAGFVGVIGNEAAVRGEALSPMVHLRSKKNSENSSKEMRSKGRPHTPLNVLSKGIEKIFRMVPVSWEPHAGRHRT